MEQIRSFIAIELPDEIKKVIARLQSRLKYKASAKWVNPYGIHLTLKFLGNIDADRTGEITEALKKSAEGIPPFHLEVGGLGAFPNLQRVRVVWVGLSGEIDRLSELQQRIEANLAPLGFPTEARPFTPHLTLARTHNQATPEERQSLGELITSLKFEEAHGFDVHYVNLIKSQLTREGAIYSQISSIKLTKPLSTTTV